MKTIVNYLTIACLAVLLGACAAPPPVATSDTHLDPVKPELNGRDLGLYVMIADGSITVRLTDSRV